MRTLLFYLQLCSWPPAKLKSNSTFTLLEFCLFFNNSRGKYLSFKLCSAIYSPTASICCLQSFWKVFIQNWSMFFPPFSQTLSLIILLHIIILCLIVVGVWLLCKQQMLFCEKVHCTANQSTFVLTSMLSRCGASCKR